MVFFQKWTTEKGDLDIADFLRAFDFGYLEFGRYVRQNERYSRFLGLAEGCLILSSDLFFGSSNLGCDRNINIAIGARGRGARGGAAHFEPSNMVINLTKDDGNHSFAHEYAHALDFLLGTQYDQNPDYTYLSTGYNYKDVKQNVGGNLRAVVTKIVEQAAAQMPHIFNSKIREYWRRPTEIFARSFEAWISWVFDKIKVGDGMQYSNSYLVQPWSYYKETPWVYPTDMEKLDNLFMVFCTLAGDAMNGKRSSGLPTPNKALSLAKARREKAMGKKSTKKSKPRKITAAKEKSMPPPPNPSKKPTKNTKKKTVKERKNTKTKTKTK